MALFLSASYTSAATMTHVQRATQCPLLPPLPNRALVIASLSHLHPKDGGKPSHPSSYQQLQIRLAQTLAHARSLSQWHSILTLLTGQLRRIHRLAENLDSQTTCLLQITLLLVVLLQQTLGTRIICSNAGCFPSTVVTARITLVQLKLTLRVVASIDERDTERPKTTVLRITLLEITQTSYQLFTGYVFVVGKEISLGGLAGVVDKDVRIGSHACYSAYHVAATRTSVFEFIEPRTP